MPFDPHLHARLHLVAGLTHDDAALPDRLSEFLAPIGPYQPPETTVHEQMIPGPHGDVPVRIYQPPTHRPSGAGLVWMHGGGFRGGDLDMPEADVLARELCARAGVTTVSVDYRLAVEGVHFPVPHDDVVAAWCWAAEACQRLGIDPGRLALGGASAGGNLAAGAVLRLRDEQRPLPSYLVLAYPMLHTELPQAAEPLPEDMTSWPAVLRIPPGGIASTNRNYLGDAPPTPYAFPALGTLTGLPPTLIITSEYDELRPSGETFADALRAAGVDVTLHREPGAPHGHLNLPGLNSWDHSLGLIVRLLAGSGVA